MDPASAQASDQASDQASKLSVALVQAASTLDLQQNREALSQLVPRDQDLVVLPEAWSRDFGEPGSPLGEVGEPVDGPFAQALAEAAERAGTCVVAGMFEQADDPERPYNTLLARGTAEAAYRKIHLYDSFGFAESDLVTPGETDDLGPQLTLQGWQVGLMTCYDLRFPELARRLVAGGAEVLVLPSAWVAGPGKVEHWRTLARARAIENVCYVVAVGQPGPRYTGHSLVVDPRGEVVVEAGAEETTTLTVELSREALGEARHTNPSLGNTRLQGTPR